MARKHTVDEVIKSLDRKRDVKLHPKDKIVEILDGKKAISASGDLGNGSWGKIDFLVNHQGWQKVFVTEF
jgi:hypothetical protein